jgi:hypothetical protein
MCDSPEIQSAWQRKSSKLQAFYLPANSATTRATFFGSIPMSHSIIFAFRDARPGIGKPGLSALYQDLLDRKIRKPAVGRMKLYRQ